MSFRILFLASLAAAATPDLLIVGGIAGLSAAAEAARLGLRVTVVDRYHGGHVVMPGVAIVAPPAQQRHGIKEHLSWPTKTL